MNNWYRLAAVVAACASALVAPATQAQSRRASAAAGPQQLAAIPLTSADLEFMLQAASYAHAAVAAAELALARSDTPRIRALAQRMLADHGAAAARLREIAVARGVALPRGTGREQTLVLDGLRGLRGAAFERDFLQRAAVNEHQELMALLHRQATAPGRDADLARLAKHMLPRVHEHVVVARTLHEHAAARSAGGAGS